MTTTIPPSHWSPESPESSLLDSSVGILQVDNARKPWSFRALDDNSFRFEVRPGDQFKSSYYTDPAGVERNNVQEISTNLHPMNDPVQIQYRLSIEPGPPNTAEWLVLGSLKGQYPQSWSAPVEMGLRGERLVVRANYEPTPGNVQYRDVFVDPQPITRDFVYEIKLQVKFGPLGDGFVKVWKDGTSIVDYSGMLGYRDQTGYLWKEGIYRSSSSENIAVVISDLSIRTGSMVPEFAGTSAGASPLAAGDIMAGAPPAASGFVFQAPNDAGATAAEGAVAPLSSLQEATAADPVTDSGLAWATIAGSEPRWTAGVEQRDGFGLIAQ